MSNGESIISHIHISRLIDDSTLGAIIKDSLMAQLTLASPLVINSVPTTIERVTFQ